MSTPQVIGIDPSLSCTGIAGNGWCDTIPTRDRRRGKKNPEDPVEFMHARMKHLRQTIAEFLTDGADLAVIEGFAMSPGMDIDRQLAWLNWTVRDMLWRRGIPYAVVSPTGLKRYVLGKGNRTVKQVAADVEVGRSAKHPVVEAVRAWFPWFDGDDNAADAVALWCMGMDWLGRPPVEVSGHARGALAAVRWPAAPTLAVAA